MYKPLFAVLCAACVLAPLSARAGEVSHREAHQQYRIYQGVRNGTISASEYANLERQESRLNAQRVRDLRDGDGNDGLNRRQYVRLNREENRLSRKIYRVKHDIGHH